MQRGGENHPRKDTCRGVDRRLGAATGQEPGERAGGEDRQQEQRHDEGCERQGIGRDLRAEPALVAGPGKRRQHDHSNPVGGEEHDHEDRVGGEEAVRLRGATEVTGDDDPDDAGEARLHGHREGCDGSAAERSEAARVCALAHRRDSVDM